METRLDIPITEPTRDERRLLEIQEKLRALHLTSTGSFNLLARQQALRKLEGILLSQVDAHRSARRATRPRRRSGSR